MIPPPPPMDESPPSIPSAQFVCLVCGSSSDQSHLGVDACRACTIFYRRVRNSTKFLHCRTGYEECEVGRRAGSCKRCRFLRFDRLLKQEATVASTSSIPPSYCWAPATRVVAYSPPSPHRETDGRRPLYARLRHSYNHYVRRRVVEESKAFYGRIIEDDEDITFSRSTHANFLKGAVILITSLFRFAACAFDEFSMWTESEQWQVILNTYEVFVLLEIVYRNEKHFPNDDEVCIGAYTTCCRAEDIQRYFEGSKGNIEEAKSALQLIRDDMARCRAHLRVHPIDEEEFVTALGLQLWNSMNGSLPDHISAVFDHHRSRLLLDLHSHYREDLGLDDYATRLGSLFTLLASLKSSINSFREHFEMYYLVGVLDETTFPYQLVRL